MILLPAGHDEISGEVAAEQDVLALDLRDLCGTGHADTRRRMFHYAEAWGVLHVV